MKIKEELKRMKEELGKKLLFLIALIVGLSLILYIHPKLILFVHVYSTIIIHASFVYV